jgi:hypothetical protein
MIISAGFFVCYTNPIFDVEMDSIITKNTDSPLFIIQVLGLI